MQTGQQPLPCFLHFSFRAAFSRFACYIARSPIRPQGQTGRNHNGERIGGCVRSGDSRQPHPCVQQIKQRDQQKSLPKHGSQRGLEGATRCLQEVAAELVESEERTDRNEPDHEAAAERKVCRIL